MTLSIRRPPKDTVDTAEIYALLHELGLSANFTGFFHTMYAVYLAIQQPDRLRLVTKLLYPEVAKHYATTWKCVERNIRTAVSTVWSTNPKLLESLARHPLSRKPKASEFLSILTLYFLLDGDTGQ